MLSGDHPDLDKTQAICSKDGTLERSAVTVLNQDNVEIFKFTTIGPKLDIETRGFTSDRWTKKRLNALTSDEGKIFMKYATLVERHCLNVAEQHRYDRSLPTPFIMPPFVVLPNEPPHRPVVVPVNPGASFTAAQS